MKTNYDRYQIERIDRQNEIWDCANNSVAITKYFTLNTFFEKSTRTKYFVNFII